MATWQSGVPSDSNSTPKDVNRNRKMEYVTRIVFKSIKNFISSKLGQLFEEVSQFLWLRAKEFGRFIWRNAARILNNFRNRRRARREDQQPLVWNQVCYYSYFFPSFAELINDGFNSADYRDSPKSLNIKSRQKRGEWTRRDRRERMDARASEKKKKMF